MHDWFYRLEGREEGPISEEDLKHIFDSGVLSLDTPVWRDGLPDWIPAEECQEFAKVLKNDPASIVTNAANPKSKTILIGVVVCVLVAMIAAVVIRPYRSS